MCVCVCVCVCPLIKRRVVEDLNFEGTVANFYSTMIMEEEEDAARSPYGRRPAPDSKNPYAEEDALLVRDEK